MADEGWDDDDGGWDDDGEDGGEEWPEEDEAEEEEITPEVKVENLFTEGEMYIRDDPEVALEKFEECYKLEQESKEIETMKYGFKALKTIVALNFQTGKLETMRTRYKELLSYATHKDVTRNDFQTAIDDTIFKIQSTDKFDLVEDIYQTTIDTLKKEKIVKLWFKVCMMLCKLYVSKEKNDKAESLLAQLHKTCQLGTGEDDPQKGEELMAIYALRIQMESKANNVQKLQELFEKTKSLSASITDPESMSVIKECSGKMNARDGNWGRAYNDFFEAFFNYNRNGNVAYKRCLKYYVVASILANVDENPFSSQEANACRQDSDIVGINLLRDAYESNDIRQFEKVLVDYKSTIVNDEFIAEQLDKLWLRLRSRVVVRLIKPYRRVKFAWLAKQLYCSVSETETLVVNLMLDGQIRGKIDQMQGLLDREFGEGATDKTVQALTEWADKLKALRRSLAGRASHQRGRGGMMGGFWDEDFDMFGGGFPLRMFGGFE